MLNAIGIRRLHPLFCLKNSCIFGTTSLPLFWSFVNFMLFWGQKLARNNLEFLFSNELSLISWFYAFLGQNRPKWPQFFQKIVSGSAALKSHNAPHLCFKNLNIISRTLRGLKYIIKSNVYKGELGVRKTFRQNQLFVSV